MRTVAFLAALLAAAPVATASAQAAPQANRMKEERPGLLAQAAITPDSARSLALARVPGGRIHEAEIEMEDERLVYSFDISVPGQRGVEEVLIDAKTGAFISEEHESSRSERAEKRQESGRSGTEKHHQRSPRDSA